MQVVWEILGSTFLTQDPAFKNAKSRDLLTKVIGLVESKKFKIINIDATIICQSPRLSEFIPKMIENIAVDCKCEESQVNIKATTTEMMGFIWKV